MTNQNTNGEILKLPDVGHLENRRQHWKDHLRHAETAAEVARRELATIDDLLSTTGAVATSDVSIENVEVK